MIIIALAVLLPPVTATADEAKSAKITTAAEKAALDWLRSQFVPNEFIPIPDAHRRSLILSYAPAGEKPGPLHTKCTVYDAALAAIALTLLEDWDGASRLLHALARVQRRDGSFWFSYNVHNTWPDEADHDMAIVRAGATAWAGYAFSFYLENRPATKEPRLLRERQLFLQTSRRIAGFLLELRVTDVPAARGLLRGGRGIVGLTVGDSRREVLEVYEDRPIRWVSTEHNISAYFFLSAMARLTSETGYSTAAREIRERLLASLWQEDMGQFAQGLKEDGTVDRTRALDCASWGALFLSAAGDPERAARALRTADIYRNSHAGIEGYRPYHQKPIYETPQVQRILLPDAPGAQWNDLAFVWSEGTLGVALAHIREGNTAPASRLLREMLEMSDHGGIRYGSRDLPYEFSGSPSVAGTAWYLIVREALKDPKAKGFWLR